MKPYVRTYLRYFGYSEGPDQDFIPCEIPGCERRVVDVHHIESRGMGGTRKEWINEIENLMGLCRECHDEYGDKAQWIDFLKEIHLKVLMKCKRDNEKTIYYDHRTASSGIKREGEENAEHPV